MAEAPFQPSGIPTPDLSQADPYNLRAPKTGNLVGFGGYGTYTPPNVNYTSGTGTGGGLVNTALSAPGSNVSNLPSIGTLTAGVDAMNVAGQTAANAARIPGNPALEQQSSTLIGQELAGQVPQDVVNFLGQQAAERGIGTGIGANAANTNAALLRSLGLTSIQQQQTGESNLTSADARNPGAPLFDPTTQLLTPGQAGSLAGQQAGLSLDQQKLNEQAQMDAANLALNQAKFAWQQQQYWNQNQPLPSQNYSKPTASAIRGQQGALGQGSGAGSSWAGDFEPASTPIYSNPQGSITYSNPNYTVPYSSNYGHMTGGSGGFGTSGITPDYSQDYNQGYTSVNLDPLSING